MKISDSELKKMDKRLKQKIVNVGPKDIDTHGQVCCPPQTDELWDMHPRVYMPVKHDKTSVCPYCGAVYKYNDK